MQTPIDDLLAQGPIAINIGVQDFAESLRTQEVQVVDVDWSPPAGGDQEMIDLLDELL